MGRSLKKGPYIAPKLLKKIEAMNERGDKKVDVIVLPKNAFDSFGDDLIGENYARLQDEFAVRYLMTYPIS